MNTIGMKRTGLVCAVLVSALAVPSAAQNREHQQLAAETRMLQEQAQQLAMAVAQLAEALKAINARIDDTTNANRRGFADQKALIDAVATDVRRINERTEDTNVRIGTLREELEALRSSVVAMQQAIPLAPPAPVDPNAPVDPSAPVVVPPSPAPAPLPSTLGLSPSRMMDTAKADYFAGQYSLAISGFEAFLNAFPRSESAGEAQFFIGESFYTQNRWADAIAAYNLVIQNYPTSTAVPEAYYKRGVAQERAGQVDEARGSYETVIKSHPDSDGARLAKQSLDRLGRQRQGPQP